MHRITPKEYMVCYSARFNGKTMKFDKFSCDQVRELKDQWIKEFRDVNNSLAVEKSLGVDRRYEEYKKEIEDFISNCKCQKDFSDEGKNAGENMQIAKDKRRCGRDWYSEKLKRETNEKNAS